MNHYCQIRRKLVPHIGSKREILDGILYQLKNGCNWCDLPKDLPPYSTVFWHYKQWRESGVIEKIRDVLHSQVRQQVKKKRSGTTLIIIDSQAVKNTCNAGVKSKGFCFYKATNGIKRHLAVDSLGFPFFTHCTKASVSDDAGLIEMLSDNIDYFKSKPVNIPKITILLDHGYHPEKIIEELKKIYPGLRTKIPLKLSPKPSKAEKKQEGKTGFVPVKARWVIERANSWMERCKSLSKKIDANSEKCYCQD